MEKLNILMATPRYYPYVGGVETHVYEVGRRLADYGHRITVLTTMPSASAPSLPHEEESQGMQIIRVPAWPRGRDYYFAPGIRSVIKQTKWDIIHCQSCHTFVPLQAMLAAKGAHLPYVLTFHSGGHSSNIRNGIRGLQWKMLRPLLKNASTLIGVSHFEADYFRDFLHLPTEKFVVISNGSTLPALPSSYSVPTGQTLIASVGRLERYKGHQRLITALPKIREWYPDARLMIIGSGPYENTLRELIKITDVDKYVEIISVPSDDRLAMAKLLSQAALVTLLSDYEAHPVAVMEAISLHRPVLVTETSGLKELADQGLVRAIPLQSSPDEVAQAVRKQIEEPVLPPASFTLPTWDACANQLQEVYQTSIRRQECVS
jgi:glycosyltransferase involved in cell wall biosynthesis